MFTWCHAGQRRNRGGGVQASDEVVATNVERVRAVIDDAARVGARTAADVRIVAAVKYVDTDMCRSLLAAGVTDLGENRGAELERKQTEFEPADPVANSHDMCGSTTAL